MAELNESESTKDTKKTKKEKKMEMRHVGRDEFTKEKRTKGEYLMEI